MPTDSEWTILSDFLGGKSVAGGKLKEAGNEHWPSPNTGATNETGFTSLPGGCARNGIFDGLGAYAEWWSSTRNKYNTGAIGRSTWRNELYWGGGDFYVGLSVRCVRDEKN